MPYRQYKVYDPRHHYVKGTVKLGRRGMILALLGFAWLIQGFSALANEASVYTMLDNWDIPRALAWFITGLAALYYSRKSPGYDIYGFFALYIMCCYRIVAYGASFVWYILPGGFDGNPRGIVGVLSWSTIVILLLAVSGWDENRKEAGSDDGY